MNAELETEEAQPELAAFHHATDMTMQVRFLVGFFIVTTLIALAFLGGVIALVSWVVNR